MSIGRFRSTAAFSPRTRANVVAVDRATFVIFSIGERRFGVSVERVERVLRADFAHDSVTYDGRSLTLANLASALGLALAPSLRSRVLVLSNGQSWIAAAVDAVHEVATIDASVVAPLVDDGTHTYLPLGARGVFTRQEQTVLVLDVARALKATANGGQPEYSDLRRNNVA